MLLKRRIIFIPNYSKEFSTKNLDCAWDFGVRLFTLVAFTLASFWGARVVELFDRDEEETGLFKPNDDKGLRACAVKFEGERLDDILLLLFRLAKLELILAAPFALGVT